MFDKSPNWYERYSASKVITVRVESADVPGSLARILEAVATTRAQLGDIKLIGVDGRSKVRDIQMFMVDDEHQQRTVDAIAKVDQVKVLSVTDDVLEVHRHGSIETRARVPLESLMDLRMVYTPGVASVCELLAKEPDKAWEYTAVGQKIAIVTNGTAVLGLGNIGPLASLPVMEGKAAILSKFVGVSAEPLLIESQDVDEVVNIVAKCAKGYGAIQLEDIAAPACFEIEERLQKLVDVPVFHDDQHGTATVLIGGLINALKRTEQSPENLRAVMLGAGAAGTAIARFLMRFGVKDVVVVDSKGAIYEGREGLNPAKTALAKETNQEKAKGPIEEVIKGRNLFVGVSKPNTVTPEMVRSMAKNPIVFALANPVSEISVRDALQAGAAVALDGRGMNNALAYPGLFRGALNARAKQITHEMKLAAAQALADAAVGDALLPDMLDMSVHERVTQAVMNAAPDAD